MLRGSKLLKVFIPGYRATILEDNTYVIFSEAFILFSRFVRQSFQEFERWMKTLS